MRITTNTEKKVVVSILEKEMKIYDDFIKACEIIKEAAKKWDGKVFNARFINAVNKELEVIGGDKFAQFVKLSRGFNGDVLKLLNRDRCTITTDKNGYESSHTVDNYEMFIEYDTDKLLVNGRLNAEAMRKSIEGRIEYMMRSIEQKQRAISEFDEVVAKVDELREMVSAAIKEFPKAFYTKFNLELNK